MNTKNIIMIKDLSFRFSQKLPQFFDKVSLEFSAGKMHFIRGKNGSGKSTLFRLLQGKLSGGEIMTGTMMLDSESYQLDDQESRCQYTAQIKTVQQRFDDMLASQFSFSDNLRFANMPSRPGLLPLGNHKKLPDLLLHFGIDMNKAVRLLSGGQRQILAILMVLQKPGKILLLDEPTAALDDQNAIMVMEFIQMIVKKTGVTVLIICHDQDLVERYASGGYYQLIINATNGQRAAEYISLP